MAATSPRWSPTCARTTSTSTWPGSHPYLEFRFPRIGVDRGRRTSSSSCGRPSSPGTCSGRSRPPAARPATSTPRPSGCRCAVSGFDPGRHLLTCNGGRGAAARRPGRRAVRRRRPLQGLEAVVVAAPDAGDRHPADASTWSTGPAGSRAAAPPTTWCTRAAARTTIPPVNAHEAEARRARRFERDGPHYGGDRRRRAGRPAGLAPPRRRTDYPLTLDLRRRVPQRWGRVVTVLEPLPGRAPGSRTWSSRPPAFDEFAAPDGTVRDGLVGAARRASTSSPNAICVHAQREVARLLEDDNVTYTPSPASSVSIADRHRAESAGSAGCSRAAALAARPAAADPRRPGVVRARGRGGAARRAARRDPGRPVRRPAAAGPAGHPAGRRSSTTTSTCGPWSGTETRGQSSGCS